MHNQQVRVMSDTAFSQWLFQEMDRRRLSERKFAKFLGLPSSTVNWLLNLREPGEGEKAQYPRLDTLAIISRRTGADLCTLMAMFFPEESRTRADVMIIAQRLASLPVEQQEIIDRYILGGDFTGSE